MRQAFKQLEIRLRAMVPRSARRIFRAARSFKTIETSRKLPKALIQDCKFCASRLHMLEDLPKRGFVAELGTDRGDFAREILTCCKPRELHLIDIDYSRFDESRLTDPSVKRHRGLTHEVISTFPDGYFDWVYVDADHSYSGTAMDARASAPKIRPGGFLVFNDFAHIDPDLGRYGVHRAVVDFAREVNWPFHYFAFDGAALYDVALRKPPE